MNYKFEISVIIPTFKPQHYLWKCLESLCDQTLDNEKFEIIIVLNGCDEPYNSEIKEWVSTHRILNVNYIQLDGGGVSNARNVALDVANGKYITFIDDDDYVSRDYLFSLLLNANRADVVISRPIAFDDITNQKVAYPMNEIALANIGEEVSIITARRFFSGPCMKLFRRDIIGTRRFNTSFSVGEDGLFMFLISDKIKKIRFADLSAVYYRRYREGSLLSSKRPMFWRSKNNLRMFFKMLQYYVPFFWKYNIIFTFMQLASVLKGVFRIN